jgi:serine/threonine protein kinase
MPVMPPLQVPSTGKLPPNTRVADRYLISKLLGQGGMGAVYLVMDTRLGNKQCALKEMSDSAIQDPGERQKAIQAFRQEAQMLSCLSHPGLPRVTDFFSRDDKHFLVMDFIEGRSLSDLLEERQSPFPESRVLDWGNQLSEVLHYLHSQTPPIVYRDLKPDNIIASTNKERLRLIDFGAARTFKPQQGKDTTAIGTPGYAPPEQYGMGQTDARSDVYALGATLHQLLTLHDPGQRLFQFPAVRSLNPNISPHIEAAIARAVDKDISLRWQTVVAFQDALQPPQPKPISLSLTPGVATLVAPSVIGKTASGVPVLTPSAPAPVTNYKRGDYGPRFGAFLIDNIILAAGCFLLFLPFMGSSSEDSLWIMILLQVLWVFGYYTYFHTRAGRTPGKVATGLKVICQNGSPLSWPRALWRTVVFLVFPAVLTAMFYVGWLLYFIPLFDKKNRGLHDILAGTWVVRT